MLVLGIESSCDDTGVALFHTQKGLIADLVYSQLSHIEYGGVVPELASRDHIQKIIPLIDQLFKQANITPSSVDGIAYTQGPGLAGALLVGATVAQGLRLAWQCPAIGVHHLEGHLLAPMLADPAPKFPFLALLVSGGHTQIIQVQDLGEYQLLGESLDDAVGEAFDKTAKLMGLPYPGGPALAQKATKGNAKRFQFPRPLINRKDLNFSFSGLKTHVAKVISELELTEQDICDISAQFEETICDILVSKMRRAVEQTQTQQVVVSGGVAANLSLRNALTELAKTQGFSIFFPPLKYCTDNGAMIAFAGAQRLLRGEQSDFSMAVRARWPLAELSPAHI